VVFTGTDVDGTALTAGNLCADWTDIGPGVAGVYGINGLTDAPSGYWTNRVTHWCDITGRLYCFEDTTRTSCLDVLDADPAAPSGTYSIDLDGPGGNAPFDVYCDMTTAGGGWTVISFEDFTGGASGWSVNTTTSCGGLGEMLGGVNVFGQGASPSKTYSLAGISHTEVHVGLDFNKLESWDGELGRVYVDGVLVFEQAFSYTQGTDQCGNPGWYELAAPVTAQRAHTAASVALNVTSTLDQAASDEAFGIDNVRIMVR